MLNLAKVYRRLSNPSRDRQRRRTRTFATRAREILGPEWLETRDVPAQFALGSLLLDGTFTTTGSTTTSSGLVQIGFAPTASETFLPLTNWTGTLSFTQGGSAFDFNGTIAGIEQASTPTIATIAQSQTFSVDSLTTTGVAIGGGSPIGVYGASLTPSLIELIDPAGGDTSDAFVGLQGALGFAELPGMSVPVSGANLVQMSPSYAAPGLSLTAAATSSSFSAFGLNVGPASLSVSYSTLSGSFAFSGSVSVATTSGDFSVGGNLGTPDSPGLIVNQSGDVTALSVTMTSAISTNGLTLNANGLTLDYQTAAINQYIIASGTVSVAAIGNAVTFAGTFGNGTIPGVVLDNGSLTGLDVTVSASMNVQGLVVSAAGLQFVYESDTSSPYYGEFLIASGSVTIATSAGDTSFAATFGNGTNPGLVIANGNLESLYATVTSTINAQGLAINAASLLFSYNGGEDVFQIVNGSVSIDSGTVTFASASFGQVGTSGLVISNGVLTGLDITITSQMTVAGMSLAVDSVDFVYHSVANEVYGNFQIASGSVSLSAGSSGNALSFSGTFGTTINNVAQPGLSLSNGVLESFSLAITSDINIADSLTLSTTSLVFAYDASSQTFQIATGSVSVVDTSGDFNFEGTFGVTPSGATTIPGLVVTNGVLTGLDITITSTFTAADVTFTATGLNFSYNATGDQYEIASGAISFQTVEGFAFSASFGLPDPSDSSTMLPGLVIAGGALTEFNAALTASFTVAGLVINVNDMAMVYGAGQYAMYGTVTVNTSSITFTGTIGQPSASPPGYGLIIEDNSLQSLAITITSTVTFGDLSMTANGLSFNYDSSPESFTLYGQVTTSIAGVTFTGNLGDASLPGLSIVNGQLTTLNLGVTANFTLFGLSCNVQDLTFQYFTSNNDVNYVLYGSLSVAVSGNTMSATMGDSDANAGLTIVNGQVTGINMVINGSFNISGFGFSIVDAGLTYTSTQNQYEIFGTFTLTDIFTASVQLGTGSSNPGITITNGVFQLDNFAFSLDNVPIGAFTLNSLTISYASANDVWSGAGQVTFPTGWSISASLQFINGDLNAISLAYDAGTSPGIAIPDTGIFVTEISASLQNLTEPESIVVSGTIEAVFGKQIQIGGVTCVIFAALGQFTADSQQLVITGEYYEGAYENNGKWTGLLGSGTASVDLNWAAGSYSASLEQSFYEGIFTISASMAFNDSGDLGLIATASVNVPNGIPFIGGTSLGSMSFAFIYTAATNTGLVAAWTNVNCYFFTVTTGFQYNFSTTSLPSSSGFAIIGSNGVADIENDFNSITSSSAPPIYVYTYTVNVPASSGANGLSVQAMWPSNSGTQTLLIGGQGTNPTYYSATSPDLPSTDQFLTSYTTSTSQSVMTNGSTTNLATPLPYTSYTFQVQSTYQFASSADVTFTNQLYYMPPTIAVTSVPTSALEFVPSLAGSAAGNLASGTTITLYVDTTSSGYDGRPVGTFPYAVDSSGNLQGVPTINLSNYTPGTPVYIYATINDGVNTTVTSTYSAGIVPVPNLVGQVVDQFGNPIAGIRIFLDLDNDGTYDAPVYGSNGTITSAGDPSVVTNLAGAYYFNNLSSYSTTDIGYPTFRVMAVMPSVSYTPITPSNNVNTISLTNCVPTTGDPCESIVANFTINRLASISGSLYSDLAQNGVYNASDPALGGVNVFLDTNGNGVYDAGEPTCVTGPSGTYGFFDLTPATYTMGIITATTAGGSTVQNYVVTQPASGFYSVQVTSDAQQLTNYVFGVISLATFSGSVVSQNSPQSAPIAITGVTLNLSTPNTKVSVPSYTSFSGASGLVMNGASVSSSGGLAMLGASQSGASNSAWYATPIPMLGGFDTSFQWSMTSANASSGGFAFVIQNTSTSAKGSSAFGYGGLASSLAIVFDAVNNQILVETGGNTANATAIGVLTSQQLGFTLASGGIITTRVSYLPGVGGAGTLNIYFSGDSSGGATPLLSVPVNLATILNLGSATSALFGFTAGSPSSGVAATVTSWSLTSLLSQTTTTDANGAYIFTGLMPKTSYTISQIVPASYVQSSPFSTMGIYSQVSLAAIARVASSAASGDYNGDGIPDIAYAISLNTGTPYQIAYAYGNGAGGFGAPVIVSLPVPGLAPALASPSAGSSLFDASIVAGSFVTTSRDYITYIAAMASGGHALVVYDILNNVVVSAIEIENSVAPATGGLSAGSPSTINNIAVGDLNNDGFDDLAVSTYGGVYTLWSLNNLVTTTGASSWRVNPSTTATPLATPMAYASTAVGYNAGVTLADFNQDGFLDLGSMGAQYIPSTTTSHGETVASWTTMTVDTSLVIAYGTGSGGGFSVQPQILFQSYNASSVYFTTNATAPSFPIPFGMASMDVSGDGIPDIELSGYTGSLQPAVFLLTQTAPGTFTSTNEVAFPNGKSFNANASFGSNNVVLPGSSLSPSQIIAVDLNGDGFNDVAAVDPNVGQILLITSQGAAITASSTSQVQVLTGGALPQFAVADYDLNGYPDLIIPGQNQTTTQSAPVLILNGTLNVGSYSYTPTNGQALNNQNFINENFGTTTNAAPASSAQVSASAFNVQAKSLATPPQTFTVTGRVFVDASMNTRFNARETGLGGVLVYLDMNQNGQYDAGIDPSTWANSQGYYALSGLVAGRTYTLGVANLPPLHDAPEVRIEAPPSGTSGVIHRSIPVTERWSIPQPVRAVDPLVPIAIDLAPLAFRNLLTVRPKFELVGTVPEGMTIDPYTGQIRWTPTAKFAGKVVQVTVKVRDADDPSPLKVQLNPFQIQVNSVSPVAAYVRDIYGALLFRIATPDEVRDASNRIRAGETLLDFVTRVFHSDEHYTILTQTTYAEILGRPPTEAEFHRAMNMLRGGGNSDRLTRQLLVGSEFVGRYTTTRQYVNAINRALIFHLGSKASTRKEVRWLRIGVSRMKVVKFISFGKAATTAKVNQLYLRYFDRLPTKQIAAQWARQLANRSLNSDSLTIIFLASKTYANGATSRPVPNIQPANSLESASFNQINHLVFMLTGAEGSRSDLNAISSQMYHGQTWKTTARTLYDSTEASTFRIQTQYQNLLHRPATSGEMNQAVAVLPRENQVESLQIQILSSDEYRRRFATTTDYASAVYQVLTGIPPGAAKLSASVDSLVQGLPLGEFVRSVASSDAGKAGQISRAYIELLLRAPTESELNQQMAFYRDSGVKDRPLTLDLVVSEEFQQQERRATLVPLL